MAASLADESGRRFTTASADLQQLWDAVPPGAKVTVAMGPTRNARVPLAASFRRRTTVILVPPEQSADLREYYSKHVQSDRLDPRLLARARHVTSGHLMALRLGHKIYSVQCYNRSVSGRGDLLREVMRETRTTQSGLSRLSGVRQPSISQFLSGKVDLSDDQLDRLLSCMGYRLEVTRRPVIPGLTRSERRSWRLHCRLSTRLTPTSLEEWRPTIERNLQRLRRSITGQPHSRNLDRWESLVGHGDALGLHRVLTGLDRDSIEMREVSPMGGLLPQNERQAALQRAD